MKNISKMLVLIPVMLIFFYSTISVASPYEEKLRQEDFYKKLALAQESGMIEVGKVISQPVIMSDPKNFEIAMIWAKDVYFQTKNPRYGLIYSDLLAEAARAYSKNNQQDIAQNFNGLAVIMFFSSQLIAREGVARCSDKTAGQSLLYNWTSRNDEFKAKFKAVKEGDQAKYLSALLKISADRDLSYKDKSACSSGISAMRQAIDKNECEKTSENNYACSAERYVSSEDGFISDDQWGKARLSLRDELSSYLLN